MQRNNVTIGKEKDFQDNKDEDIDDKFKNKIHGNKKNTEKKKHTNNNNDDDDDDKIDIIHHDEKNNKKTEDPIEIFDELKNLANNSIFEKPFKTKNKKNTDKKEIKSNSTSQNNINTTNNDEIIMSQIGKDTIDKYRTLNSLTNLVENNQEFNFKNSSLSDRMNFMKWLLIVTISEILDVGK